MPLAPNLIRSSRQFAQGTTRRAANLRDRLFDSRSLVQAEQTPHEVILEEGIVRLRYYPPLAEASMVVSDENLTVRQQPLKVPLVLVAPLAVNMAIYDLFPQRSLVKYLRARGFELYLMDWGRPDGRHDHYRIATYITEWMPKLIEQVRLHSGQRRLSLHGWSFGGLFSYGYAAYSRDPDIENIVLVGAPCDYHDNGPIGRQYQRLARVLKLVGKNPRLRPHASSPRWWRAPGWANSLLYKLMTPVSSIKPYVQLLGRLDDRQAVSDHATNGAFLDDMVAYPGGVIQDIVQYLWADNVLAHGRLPIPDCEARLNQIKANLLLIAGDNDPIVTQSCTQRLLAHVSSPDHSLTLVPGGHMAIVSGSQAPVKIWPLLADWLEARSH